jgi:8-oxo-dGTP pyrophosphatase MutT (NUDIX family)
MRRPAARVVCLADDLVLLLQWRDPVGGAEFWEPPGGALEDGEDWEEAARRELFEETGLVAGELLGPVMVERDFAWEGTRRVGPEAFFLARWSATPEVRPEADPALLATEEIQLVVQLNGKLVDRVPAPAEASSDQLEEIARASGKLAARLNGKQIVKTVVVPGKLVNFVVR